MSNPPKEPIDHVRRSLPPWRERDFKTECGRAENDCRSVLSRQEMLDKLRRQGHRRAALSSCMTCLETASRNPSWERQPSAVMMRVLGNRYGYPRHGTDENDRELVAIAMLIERHRGEWEEIKNAIRDVADFNAERSKRRRR